MNSLEYALMLPLMYLFRKGKHKAEIKKCIDAKILSTATLFCSAFYISISTINK